MEIMEERMIRRSLVKMNNEIGDEIRELKYKIMKLRDEVEEEPPKFENLQDENFYLEEKNNRITIQIAEYEKKMEGLIVQQAILIKFKDDLNKSLDINF